MGTRKSRSQKSSPWLKHELESTRRGNTAKEEDTCIFLNKIQEMDTWYMENIPKNVAKMLESAPGQQVGNRRFVKDPILRKKGKITSRVSFSLSGRHLCAWDLAIQSHFPVARSGHNVLEKEPTFSGVAGSFLELFKRAIGFSGRLSSNNPPRFSQSSRSFSRARPWVHEIERFRLWEVAGLHQGREALDLDEDAAHGGRTWEAIHLEKAWTLEGVPSLVLR